MIDDDIAVTGVLQGRRGPRCLSRVLRAVVRKHRGSSVGLGESVSPTPGHALPNEASWASPNVTGERPARRCLGLSARPAWYCTGGYGRLIAKRSCFMKSRRPALPVSQVAAAARPACPRECARARTRAQDCRDPEHRLSPGDPDSARRLCAWRNPDTNEGDDPSGRLQPPPRTCARAVSSVGWAAGDVLRTNGRREAPDLGQRRNPAWGRPSGLLFDF